MPPPRAAGIFYEGALRPRLLTPVILPLFVVSFAPAAAIACRPPCPLFAAVFIFFSIRRGLLLSPRFNRVAFWYWPFRGASPPNPLSFGYRSVYNICGGCVVSII